MGGVNYNMLSVITVSRPFVNTKKNGPIGPLIRHSHLNEFYG
jgi:hypothetical protein